MVRVKSIRDVVMIVFMFITSYSVISASITSLLFFSCYVYGLIRVVNQTLHNIIMTRIPCVDFGIKLIFLLTHAVRGDYTYVFAFINFQPIHHNTLLFTFDYNKSYTILSSNLRNRFADTKFQLKKNNNHKSYVQCVKMFD